MKNCIWCAEGLLLGSCSIATCVTSDAPRGRLKWEIEISWDLGWDRTQCLHPGRLEMEIWNETGPQSPHPNERHDTRDHEIWDGTGSLTHPFTILENGNHARLGMRQDTPEPNGRSGNGDLSIFGMRFGMKMNRVNLIQITKGLAYKVLLLSRPSFFS